MVRILFGLFFVLHGLVHLLYFGQSARYFELQPGMVWPDGSWLFSRLFQNATIRNIAGILLILTAAGFVAAGTRSDRFSRILLANLYSFLGWRHTKPGQ
jgi:hypothetical protein